MMTSQQELSAENKLGHQQHQQDGAPGATSQSEDIMTSSLFASNLVIFGKIAEQYTVYEEILLHYRLENGFRCRARDFVALYPYGWSDPRNFIAFKWAPKRAQPGTLANMRHVRFPAADMQDKIKEENTDFYQFVYVTKKKEIAGASSRFLLTRSPPAPPLPLKIVGSVCSEEGVETDTQFICIDSPLLASDESLATEQQPAKSSDTFEMVTRQMSSPAMVLGTSQSFTSHTEDLGALIIDLKQLEEDIVKIALKTNASYVVDVSDMVVDAKEDAKSKGLADVDVIGAVSSPACQVPNRHPLYSVTKQQKDTLDSSNQDTSSKHTATATEEAIQKGQTDEADMPKKETVPLTPKKTWAEALRDGYANSTNQTMTSPTTTPGTTTVTLATTPTDGMLISSTCTKTTVATLDCRVQLPEPEPDSHSVIHGKEQDQPLDLSQSFRHAAKSFWEKISIPHAQNADVIDLCGDSDQVGLYSDAISIQSASVEHRNDPSDLVLDLSGIVPIMDVNNAPEANFVELNAYNPSPHETSDVITAPRATSSRRAIKSKLNCKECRKKLASMRSLRSKRTQAESNLARLRSEAAELESIVSVKELLTRELSNQVKNLVQEKGHLATVNDQLFTENQTAPTPYFREVQDAEVTCKMDETQLERRNAALRNKMGEATKASNEWSDNSCQRINAEMRDLRRQNHQLLQEQDDIMYTLSLQGYTNMKTASGTNIDLSAKHGRVVELQGWLPNATTNTDEHHKESNLDNSMSVLNEECEMLRSIVDNTGLKVVEMQSNIQKVVSTLADLRRQMCKLTDRVTQMETREEINFRDERRDDVCKMRRHPTNCHGAVCDHVRNLRAVMESSQAAHSRKQSSPCSCRQSRNVTPDSMIADTYCCRSSAQSPEDGNMTEVLQTRCTKPPKKRHSSDVRQSSKVVRAEDERPLSGGSRPRSEHCQRQLEKLYAAKDALKGTSQPTSSIIAQSVDLAVMSQPLVSGVAASDNCSQRQIQVSCGQCCCAANSAPPGDQSEYSSPQPPPMTSPFSWQLVADAVSCDTAPLRPTATVNPTSGAVNASASSSSSSAVRSRKICKKQAASGLITRRCATSESRAMADPAVPPECPQCHARFRYSLSVDQFLMHMKQHQPSS